MGAKFASGFTSRPDGAAQLHPDRPGAQLELSRYVESIELFRQLVAMFQHPLDIER